ncbi:MAG: DUF4160 domain-containing protein [Nostoc sp.]|uniref:DUF4160 domain-containing protein n=1 Tax=Nostoc sp. TaxID=1180 RepID=UPI002FFA175F
MKECQKLAVFSELSSQCTIIDHPPPHFHVRYNNQKAIVSIQTLEILEGELTPRQTHLTKVQFHKMHSCSRYL